MNQGAVLGLRRGHFQRVPASSHWLWARLEGGSLKIQLPHRDAWALGLCTTPQDKAVCVCVLVFPPKRRQGQMVGVPGLTAEPAAVISPLPKPEF